MVAEGVDASYIDKEPTELIPVDLDSTAAGGSKPEFLKKIASNKERKKKLFWTGAILNLMFQNFPY